jgi:tRNA1(Val) A37 N6-methylase TrmN6
VDIDPGAVEIAKLRLWLSLVVDEEDVKQIKPLPNLFYKIVTGNSLLGVEKNLFNQQLFQQLEKLKVLYFDQSDQSEKSNLRQKIDHLIHELTNGKEAFDFEIYFSEVFHRRGGFDVVIANPPYVTFKGKQKVQVDPALVEEYERIYTESAEYKINSFALFIEKGLRLLPCAGVLSFIIPSTLLQNEYLKKIRRFILSEYSLDQIVSFANQVFEAVTDSIVIVVSTKSQRRSVTKVFRRTNLDFRPGDAFTSFDSMQWLQAPASVMSIRASGAADAILNKMTSRAKPLETYLEAKIGIKRADAPIRDKPGGRYKPFLLGRDMSRYRITFPNSHILFDTSCFHTPVDEDIFLQPEKILVRKTGSSIVATLDISQYYTDQTLYNLFPKHGIRQDLCGVLGQLNCKLLGFYFSKVCVTNPDIYPYIKGIHLKQLPIQVDGIEGIARLANRILAAKARDASADVSAWEREIDQLVYALYGLTPEEIQIVEGASAKATADKGAAK